MKYILAAGWLLGIINVRLWRGGALVCGHSPRCWRSRDVRPQHGRAAAKRRLSAHTRPKMLETTVYLVHRSHTWTRRMRDYASRIFHFIINYFTLPSSYFTMQHQPYMFIHVFIYDLFKDAISKGFDSLIGIGTVYGLESRARFSASQHFLFSTAPRTDLGPSQLPIE
jgi:hypothetical protein